MSSYNVLDRYHPIVATLYFISVICVVSLNLHPITLMISLIGAITNGIVFRKHDILKYVIAGIPFMIFVTIVNVAFNHKGDTILFYVNYNPITLESVVYGAVLGTLYLTVILWFLSVERVLTSDKILIVTGYLSPEVSLVISMAMRFIPRYKAKLKEIFMAQSCLGNNVKKANFVRKIIISVNCISILITWALENAIETSDTMKCRGFGSKKHRTAYHAVRLKHMDIIAIILILLMDIVMFITSRGVWYSYTTKLSVLFNSRLYIFESVYLVMCSIPTVLTLKDLKKW
ncbi:MAG: energy-coupling factor transporter transmembrane protein EcfT [Ruminococcus sp.]|nr:energy-coupling factor transporter transmembrane protein EcfT [Ruminococcus sp.]